MPMSEISKEFKHLHHIDFLNFQNFAKDKSHRSQNRYSDILPYLHSIVKLKPSKFTEDGYINANYIALPGQTRYIATQGPLERTVGQFWQLNFEQLLKFDHVNVIMLTELYEDGREKCFDYIADIVDDVAKVGHELGFDRVVYNGLKVERNGGVEIREFSIGDKTLTHYWIRKWPDFGIPSVENDNNLFVIEQIGDEDEVCNVVHCSAGVGRSGTFISLDWLYKNQSENIYETVLKCKNSRFMMVQRIDQYKYLYKAVKG